MRVRLKLSDFIDTEYEDDVMESITKVYSELQSLILLHLWYDEGDNIKLKNFLFILCPAEIPLSFKIFLKCFSAVLNELR